MKTGLKINLDSHHINHANSKLTNTPNYPELGIEIRYIYKIVKEIFGIFARLINQSYSNIKQYFQQELINRMKKNQVFDGTEFLISFNINHNVTETDIDKFDIKSLLENQIQQQEMKDCGWRFDKINSMAIYF